MANNYNSRNGGLWVQPAGPNSQVYFLGCHDLDAVEEPLLGDVTPTRKFNPNGNGWITVGRNQTPPDPVTTTITTLLFKQKDWLEKLNCPFTLFILKNPCGPYNIFANYERGFALRNAQLLSRSYEGLIMREEEVDSTVAAEITADPILTQIDALEVDRLATTEVLSLNGIWANKDLRCQGDCGDTQEPGDLFFITADSAVGPATADILFSDDAGATITAMTADPFGAGLHAMGQVSFLIDSNTRRVLVSREGTGAVQGLVAYSDDNGTTWTTVNIGGAAVGHGCVTGRGLYALDSRHIWLASADGYIYFSEDGGETWTAVEAGTIGIASYNFIHFADDSYGISGAAADVILLSDDGGQTWYAATATGGGGDILCGFRIDENRMWVGTDDGTLWYSNDGGVTWTQRTGWIGSGVGDVMDIAFADELIGFMAHNDGAALGTILRTVDGGYTWVTLTTPVNSGLNDLEIADADTVYAVGEANGGTGVILKVTAA